MKTIPQGTPPANTLGNLRIPPTLNSPARLATFPAVKLPNGKIVEHHHTRKSIGVCALCALARNADAHEAAQGRVLSFAPPKLPRPAPRRTPDHDGGDRKVAA